MALDKNLIKQAAIQQWGDNIGVGDNQTAPVATCQGWCDIEITPQLERFALAIYALGVANERENNAKLCESFKVAIGNDEVVVAMHTAYDDCAEAIRKGE